MAQRILMLCAGTILIASLPVRGEVLCLDVLRYHTITVVDSGGGPLDGVDIEVLHVPSGMLLDVESSPFGLPGQYAVVSSLHVRRGPVRNGDELEVSGTLGETTFKERYVVRTDPGPCHPTGIEGPAEIVLEL